MLEWGGACILRHTVVSLLPYQGGVAFLMESSFWMTSSRLTISELLQLLDLHLVVIAIEKGELFIFLERPGNEIGVSVVVSFIEEDAL